MSKLSLHIRRKLLNPVTIGECDLRIDGLTVWRSHTLELPWRDNVRGMSCIPAGTYSASLTMSPRFRRKLWLLEKVPGRSGIRIHAANYYRQLEGCIAMGMGVSDIDKDGKLDIARSQEAMRLFHEACGHHTKMVVSILNP